MTDATQVNIQESDMATVREVFQKALDAIVAATSLSKQVQQMQADMDGLRRTFDEVHARNVELDRMLADTRRQRDEAEQAASALRNELASTKNNANELDQLVHEQQVEQDRLRSENEAIRNERNAAQDQSLALEDALAKANAKLKTIHDGMGVPFTPFGVAPKPAPAPQPEPAPLAWHEPTPEPIPAEPYTPPAAEPAQPARTYDGDPTFTWDKPIKFDTTMGKYYNE